MGPDFDKFKQRRYEAVKSKDLNHWEDITDRMEFVKGLRHGSVIRRAVASDMQEIENKRMGCHHG